MQLLFIKSSYYSLKGIELPIAKGTLYTLEVLLLLDFSIKLALSPIAQVSWNVLGKGREWIRLPIPNAINNGGIALKVATLLSGCIKLKAIL